MQLLRVVRKAERRMKKGLFRRSRMPEMPAMQTAAAAPETAAEPRAPIPPPEQRPGPPMPSNGGALPVTRARPPLAPRPAPMQITGKPPPPPGLTPATTPSSRPKPPPLPGARQPAEADAAPTKPVNLPPTPLRPGAAPLSPATATLAAALEQSPSSNGAAPSGGRPTRPGPPPLPRSAAATPERRTNGIPPAAQEPRPSPLAPQQLRSNGNGPNGKPGPDFSKLPPNIAESLARLAGRASVPFLGGDAPATPATADTAETGGKPPHNT
jgi:hypothetical protein